MTFSDTLSIIGLILTVIFGIWGLIAALRKRYPGKLTFVEENAIGLFNSIIKNFPEIKIQYGDKPISEQMIYLKASFINTGSIDLSTKNLPQKLKIKVPEGYKWINSKLTSNSQDVLCEISNNESELILDFDLLRTNEYIQFEAFAEITNPKNNSQTFRKNLNFSHRIPNTSQVDKRTYLTDEQIREKKFEFKKNAFFATIFLLLMIVFTTYSYITKSTDLEYVYKENNQQHIVKIASCDLNKVKITGDNDFERIVDLKTFNNLQNIQAQINKPSLWGYVKKSAFTFLYVVMYLSFMIPEIRSIYRDKRIKNIIERK